MNFQEIFFSPKKSGRASRFQNGTAYLLFHSTWWQIQTNSFYVYYRVIDQLTTSFIRNPRFANVGKSLIRTSLMKSVSCTTRYGYLRRNIPTKGSFLYSCFKFIKNSAIDCLPIIDQKIFPNTGIGFGPGIDRSLQKLNFAV